LHSLKIKREQYSANANALSESALDNLEKESLNFGQALAAREFELFDRTLGSGSFGKVHEGIWKPVDGSASKEVAVKLASTSRGEASAIAWVREQVALGAFEHPYIVRYYGFLRWQWSLTDPEKYGLVMERCLFDMSSTAVFRRGDLLQLIGQAADALAYMHNCGFLHRDIKPQNILVQGLENQPTMWEARLCDFGTAKHMLAEDAAQHTDKQGTAHYWAPGARSGKYCVGSDLYSLGKTMKHIQQMCEGLNGLFKTTSEAYKCWQDIANKSTFLPESGAGHPDKSFKYLCGGLSGLTARGISDQIGLRISGVKKSSANVHVLAGPVDGESAIVGTKPLKELVSALSVQDEKGKVDEHVWVVHTAKITGMPNPKGKSYHREEGRCGSSVKVLLSAAETHNHKPCKKCFPGAGAGV